MDNISFCRTVAVRSTLPPKKVQVSLRGMVSHNLSTSEAAAHPEIATTPDHPPTKRNAIRTRCVSICCTNGRQPKRDLVAVLLHRNRLRPLIPWQSPSFHSLHTLTQLLHDTCCAIKLQGVGTICVRKGIPLAPPTADRQVSGPLDGATCT